MTKQLDHDPSGSIAPGQRGPVEHARRTQILATADEHFRQYGYNKTTVADLAKKLNLSTAYIYKFFESKQAIGDAICAIELSKIGDELRTIVQQRRSAASRLRQVFLMLARRGAELSAAERRLHELAVIACTEKWRAVQDHQARLLDLVRDLITQGREAGEFERKTPIGETSLAVHLTMEPFSQPLFVEQNLGELEERSLCVANLVLRSMAP